jgi:small Trp-rich protein
LINAIVGTPVDPPGRLALAEQETVMYFLGLGLILLALKYFEFGPVANWSWTVVLAPFALAALWWAWADWSGYSKKKAMDRMQQRKEDRIEKQRTALGFTSRKRR